MMKRNTWIVAGLVVVIIAVVAFVATNKSDNNTAGSNYSATSASQSSTSTTKPGASSEIVTTKTDPSLGQYLANAGGKPLYTYGADTTGVSNCTGACLVNWPLYGPVSSQASLPANVTTITRSDGKVQYAYKGMPLYYFTGDSGNTPTGDGADNFSVAKP